MSNPATVHHIPQPTPDIPRFEGREVSYVVIKISGVGKVQMEETTVFSMDDLVRLVGEYRCVGVNFKEDRDGQIYREQTVVPKEIDTCPWDPDDPTDTGILRAPTGGF